MSHRTKYYKIRKIGTEEYYSGNKTDPSAMWGPYSKGVVMTQHRVNILLRYWIRWQIIDVESIQIVEYDLLEYRNFTFKQFFNKYAKTPIFVP